MSSELINQVIELTNIERVNAGLQPLTLNSQLADAAQDHSDNMATDDFFSHTGADGSNVASRVQDSGYQYSTVGENIAAGQTTAAEVVEGWMNSPGHRANILNANYTEIGIGYEYLENDTGSVNYNHYWTQVFGTSLNGNQGSVSEPSVTEDSESNPTDNVDNSADINEQPNSEVVEENNDSTPEVEVENSEQPEANEEITNEVSDSNDSISEPESNMEVEEENSDSTPEVEVENSEQPEANEEITNEASDPNDSNSEPESNMEVVEENSDSTPEIELENSGEFDTTEDIADDSFELNNSVTFEEYSFDQSSDALISQSHSVAIAGGNDAIAMFDSQGNNATQFIEHFQSNFSDIRGDSWLGMAMERYDNDELTDLIESYANSNWGEVRSNMMQEFADSFL